MDLREGNPIMEESVMSEDASPIMAMKTKNRGNNIAIEQMEMTPKRVNHLNYDSLELKVNQISATPS